MYKLIFTFLVCVCFFVFNISNVSASCTIQGNKMYYSDNKELDGSAAPQNILNALITTNTSVSSSTNPYFISVPEGNFLVTARVPEGYEVGYTICYNNMNCHSQSPVRSSIVYISCSSGKNSYIDLWWHYKKLGDFNSDKTIDLMDLLYILKLFFV